MLTRPNFQRLLKVAEASENCHLDRFDMSVLYDDYCGTAGCMIGNYNIASKRGSIYGTETNDWVHFGITRTEYYWLFDKGAGLMHMFPGGFKDISTNWDSIGLPNVTCEQALSRLRKFIYYKLHKSEMLYDDNGIREEARRKEGNHNFARRALEAR